MLRVEGSSCSPLNYSEILYAAFSVPQPPLYKAKHGFILLITLSSRRSPTPFFWLTTERIVSDRCWCCLNLLNLCLTQRGKAESRHL